MLFQRQSLPAINSICYQSNNEECVQQLRPLYLLIRENQIDVQQENITLVGLFKLLKIWKLDIPFSILAKLMLQFVLKVFQLFFRLLNDNLISKSIFTISQSITHSLQMQINIVTSN